MNNLDTRYHSLIFLMYDYKNIENYLSKMASKGWRIEHISGFLWKFKKAKPTNRKFFVVYSSKDSEINYIRAKGHKSIKEVFNESGWTKEIQWKQMQIFSAEEEVVPLEIDEAARIDSVCMTMKKTFIPSWIIGFVGLMMVTFLNGIKYFGNSKYCDEDTGWVFLITLYATVILGVALLGYIFFVKVFKKNIAEGKLNISTTWYCRLLNLLLIGFFIVVVAYFMCVKL